MKNKNNILEGTIWSSLILFALPIAFSSLLQQLFNAADQAVVGRFAGSDALAAVGANTVVVSLLVNVFASMSVGANALIARKIGEGKQETINRVVHTSITFAGTAGVILMIFGSIIARPLLTLIGTPAEILDMAVLYLRIYCLAFPFAMLYNFGAAILRSVGDTKRPMIALIAAGVINVILNLILVIVFRLGVAGVAIATAVSNLVSAAAVLFFLFNEESDLKLSVKRMKIEGLFLRQILQIGGPAAMQAAVFSIANVCIQSGINSLGSGAIAGSVVVSNFEIVSFLIMNAFCQAVITFCGQNYGAGKMDRCKNSLRTALLEALLLAFLFDITVFLASDPLIAIFTKDPVVASFAKEKFLYVILLHFTIGLYEIPGAGLRSLGYSMAPALISVVGCVGFRLLWLRFLFPAFGTYKSLMLVYPASWTLTWILMWTCYFRLRKKIYSPAADQLSVDHL